MKPHLYFIGIIPPEEVLHDIENIKKEFSENYHSRHALKSPAHITLQMPFKRKAEGEAPLKRFLEVFSQKFSPFEIELNGFGHFDKRVIFIKVIDNKTLGNLFNELKSGLLSEMNFTEKELPQHFHPHVTVAHRDLSTEHFKIAWEHFQNREFTAKFSATNVTLLKHNFKFWEVMKEFELKGN